MILIGFRKIIIINQSFQSGIFPDQLKIAKVISIFKKDDSANLDNYRPMSILPAISKVFEKSTFFRQFLKCLKEVFSLNCSPDVLLQTNYSVMANMGLGKGIRQNQQPLNILTAFYLSWTKVKCHSAFSSIFRKHSIR